MKANYLPKNRLKPAYLRRTVALLAIFIIGAFVYSFLDQTIISIFSPVWKADNVITRNFRGTFGYLSSKQTLVDENIILKEKISSLETEILSLSKEGNQEDLILGLAGRKQNSNMIVAAVLTHPPQSPYDIIIIDAGSKDSVALGSQVFMPEGPLLGRVSEVFSSSAKVKLFSASGEETNAILERNSLPITLIGKGGGNFRISLPRDIEVKIGDRILSADISSHLLAVVGAISIEPTDAFKEVLANSPTNIFSLRFVSVMP